jgi:ferritin-like metal-binding protein YciE
MERIEIETLRVLIQIARQRGDIATVKRLMAIKQEQERIDRNVSYILDKRRRRK